MNYMNIGMRSFLITVGVFCFSWLSAQKKITDYQTSIKEDYTVSYLGQREKSAVFVTRVASGYYLLFQSEGRVDSLRVGLKSDNIQFAIAGEKLWMITEGNNAVVYSLTTRNGGLKEEAVINTKDGITCSGQFLYYNRGSRFYKYDLSTKKETEVFDENGSFTYNYSGERINEGVAVTNSGSRFVFPDGRRFEPAGLKELKDPEVVQLRSEANYYIFWVKDHADAAVYLYLLGTKGISSGGKVSMNTGAYINSSNGTDYLTLADVNSNFSVTEILTGRERINMNVPVNLYFTSMTVFGGQRKLIYSKPKIVNGVLYILGTSREYTYIDGILPEDFYLYTIDLNSKMIDKYNAALMVPDQRFKGLITMSTPEIYSIGSDLVFTYRGEYVSGEEKYRFLSGHFETAPFEEYEKVSLHPVQGGFLSFDDRQLTLWTPEKKIREMMPFPDFKKTISGFHQYQKGQEFLWITHLQENGLAVSIWDGDSLKIIKEKINYNSTAGTVIYESENRINNQSMVLIKSDNKSWAYLYDYTSGNLSLLAEAEELSLFLPGSAFRFYELSDGSFIIQTNFSIGDYLVKNNSITRVGVRAFTSSGLIIVTNKGLVYKNLMDDCEVVLSADPYAAVTSGNNSCYFADSYGYHKVDENGVKITIEPFPNSGYSPRLNRVSERYLVCRVNNKMYLTDLETEVSEPVNLPFEKQEGVRYFQQGTKIIGISNENYRVYSYDVSTRSIKILQQFSTAYGSTLTGHHNLFYHQRGKTEIWTITAGELKKIHEYEGKSPDNLYPEKVTFLKSDKGYVYWNPQRALARDMEGREDLSGYRWIDSLGAKQFFWKDINKIYSFDEVTGLWQLLHSEENGSFLVTSLKAGKNLYFRNRDRELWQTNGTVMGTRKLPQVILSGEYKDSLTDYKGKLYFIAGNSLRQLWTADYEEIDIVLSAEKAGVNFSIYPNPVSEVLNIRLDIESAEMYHIQIISENGRLLDSRQLALPHDLSMKEYPPGIYFVRITGREKSETFRVLKHKL